MRMKILRSFIGILITFYLIVGGSCGYRNAEYSSSQTLVGVQVFYETTIEFYVNPRLDRTSNTEVESQYGVFGAYGRHVMDNMIKLLSSEPFAEQLLLDEVTGLPKTGDNAELDAKTAVALQAKKDAETAVATAETALETLNDLNTQYRAKTTEVNTLWSQYRNQHPNENLNSTPTKIPGEIALNNAIDEQTLLKQQVEKAQEDLTVAEDTAKNARKNAEDAKADALDLWRETYDDYERELNLVLDSISYSYYDENTSETVSDLARSFIYVKVAVMNDEDLAKEFYARIIKLVPEFVETNMAVPSGYDGTNCVWLNKTAKIEEVTYINGEKLK